MPKIGKFLPDFNGIGLEVLGVTLFLSLKLLLDSNLGENNEIDVLPLAKQYVDHAWIPGDWYLNQPPGYRLLFETVFGRLIVAWGFLTASIVGRVLCYALIALGLVFIGRRLGLRLPLLLLAIGLFLNADYIQGVAAHEWMVRSLEAKAVAYGFVLLAIWLMLAGRDRWMAFMLGLATSFHVLVGGWAFLTVLGWLGFKRKIRFEAIGQIGPLLLIYLAASIFAVKPVLAQLFDATPASSSSPSGSLSDSISASFIYVFLRLPHHLNPLAWSANWWIKPAVYLLVLVVSMGVLWQQRQKEQSEADQARMALFELTLISLVPFLLGLAIAPFDAEGRLLQFYPFRFGDVMLPLNACLLFACALQQSFTGRKQAVLSLMCVGLIGATCTVQAVTFQKQLLALRQFPKIEPEFKALCDWVRTQTPASATVVSPPVDFIAFTWLAERPTIAKYKFFPQNRAGLVNWYERLGDLNGGSFPQPNQIRTGDRRDEIEQALTEGYNHLTTAQAGALMNKYSATYFMALRKHPLDLPVAYRNRRYIIYRQ